MKSIKILFIIYFVPLILLGQKTLKGYVYDEHNQPLIGAYVKWEDSKSDVVTNESGYFEINGVPHKNHMLTISYIGFENQTIHIEDYDKAVKVKLKENNQLKEVIVEKNVPGTLRPRTELLNTEHLSRKELHRAACCNLSESFETNPSVDVSFSDAVTGAKQIQLLGLSGTYVQMLTENYPNFRGAAAVYGLDYIPGTWMESIQISKGAASVKNGYESLTGQMNVEYKKPQTADPLTLNLFANDVGRYEGNAEGFVTLNDKLSTGLFLHYSNESDNHDDNNDGFLDMPKKHQFNIMNRWQYTNGKYASQYGVRILQDYRTSGQNHHTMKSENSNLKPYEIEVDANRAEFFTKNSYMLDEQTNENFALIFTGSYHDQKSKYDVNHYNVYESNFYASLMYEKEFTPAHRFSTGLSMNWDKFNQSYHLVNPVTKQDDQETTTGGYAQYTFNKNDKFIALAGIRLDYSTLYKFFITPRLHLKYMPAQWVNIRASVGKGYRSVFVMPENSFFLASSRKINIVSDLRQERAWNYGTNISFYIPIAGRDLELSAEWYYTNFNNQVVIDVDSNPHAVSFYNLDGKSYSNSLQVQAVYSLFRGFNLLGAYRWIDTKTTYGGIKMRKPLTGKYKALVTASYETPLKKWQFDLTTQFNGGGRMPKPDAAKPLWGKNFGAYTVMNFQITKNFRTWSIYGGAENILDKTQKTSIISAHNPYSPDFDATMIWGPTQGRKIYVGLRYTFNK